MKKVIFSFSFLMSIVGMVGCVLNVYKYPSSWLIWEIGAVGFSIYFIRKRDWGAALIWLFYIPFDFFGWLVWKGYL